MIYGVLKFFSNFFWFNSVIANAILRSFNPDKGLNTTLKQLDDLIKQDRSNPEFKSNEDRKTLLAKFYDQQVRFTSR